MALPAAGTKPPDRKTIKPSGIPSWPFLLVTGREKKGKTWWAVEGSKCDLIDRTFLIEVGDGQGEEYGAIPGVDYELVPTDGSYRDIYDAVWWAIDQPAEDGKVNLPILDSGTVLWELIGSELQEVANRRFERRVERAKREGKPVPEPGPDGVDITHDLWNIGARRWYGIIDLLRYRPGPAIITARLDEVTVFRNGKPTTEKEWKPKAQKMLPYDVDGIIEFHKVTTPILTGLRSVRFNVPMEGTDKDVDLRERDAGTFDKFVRKLGLGEAVQASPRSHGAINATAGADEIEHEEATGERAPTADPKRAEAQRIADDAIVAPTLDDLEALRERADAQKLIGYPVTVDGQTGPLTGLLGMLARKFQTPPQQPPAEQPQPQAAQAPAEAPQKLSGREKQQKALLDEIVAHAGLLNAAPGAYAAPLLQQAGVGDVREVPMPALREWTIGQRQVVVEALRDQGRLSLADLLESQGAKFPLHIDALAAEVENQGQPETADVAAR